MKSLLRLCYLSLLLLGAMPAPAFFDPTIGRWASRDPIGEQGGLNLNGFAGNNALSSVDIRGLVVVGFYGADLSYKWPNDGNRRLEELSARLEAYEAVLRPDKIHGSSDVRPHRLYPSRNEGSAFNDLLRYLDRNHNGYYDPPCDQEETIKIFGWSWGGASAVELANKIKESPKFRKKKVGLVAVIDPVTTFRFGNHRVPSNVFRFWNRFQRNGADVLPLGLPNHGHLLQVEDSSKTIADQVQLDPNGRVRGLEHVTIIWMVERDFLAQFSL